MQTELRADINFIQVGTELIQPWHERLETWRDLFEKFDGISEQMMMMVVDGKTKVFLIRSVRGLDDGELYLRRLFEENFYFPPEYKLGIARGPQMKLLKHQTEETFLLHPSFEATFLHLASRQWLQNQDHKLIKIVIMVDMVEVHVLRRFYKRIKSKQFMIVAHIWMHKRYQFIFTSLMICWII